MWVYNDKLQIKFTFRSGPMIFGRVMALGLWNLAEYLVVTTFFSLCLEILTWFWVYECIMMSYRSSLHFVPVQWFLTQLWPLDFEIFICHHFISLWFEILTWFLVWEYNHKLQIKFEICSGSMIFGQLTIPPQSMDQHWTLFSLEDICHQ